MFTEISSIASKEIGLKPPPGKGSELNPKLLFKLAPSIVTLLYLPSLPAKLVPLAWGVKRVKSVMLRDIVGKVVIWRLLIFVLMPVLSVAAFLVFEDIITFSRTCSLTLNWALIL